MSPFFISRSCVSHPPSLVKPMFSIACKAVWKSPIINFSLGSCCTIPFQCKKCHMNNNIWYPNYVFEAVWTLWYTLHYHFTFYLPELDDFTQWMIELTWMRGLGWIAISGSGVFSSGSFSSVAGEPIALSGSPIAIGTMVEMTVDAFCSGGSSG